MRHGIRIHSPRDRGAEILADPVGYFSRARREAREVVERDHQRAEKRLYHPEDDRPVPAALFWVLFLGLLAIAVTAVAVALVGAWT